MFLQLSLYVALLAHEANPVMLAAMKLLGFNGAFVVKILVVALLGLMLTWYGTAGAVTLLVCDAIYAAICWHNWRIAK